MFFSSDKDDILLMLTESITNSLEDTNIEINRINKLLNELSPHKARGPENI